MNTKQFFDAMSELDSKYIDETLNYKKKAKSPGWIKCGTIAACFAVVVVAAFSVLPNYLNQQDATPPSTSEIRISMSDIIMNQVDGFASTDYARYNPETDDEVVWSKEDIAAYYGTDLTPAYIPNGLLASPKNANATVYIGRDGTVTEDTVWHGFYHAYNEDGSPKLTEAVAATQGFSITASKIGIVQTCLYLPPEDEVKTSDIEGTSVTFGYRSMPYGPYNSETHKPSGCYDMYVAEFKHNGIEYQIVAEQMKVEELVKVVTSIISGEKDITVVQGSYIENYPDKVICDTPTDTSYL